MEWISIVVIGTIALALIFDVINGFHDCANSIATVVSTRVLSPRQAVLWAAFFNFAAMFVFPAHVADTISKTVLVSGSDPLFIYVVLAGLLGAVVWDLLTWWWGLPTSSSHALIGGLVGAGLAYKGMPVVNWSKVLYTIYFIPLAPLMGLVFGFFVMVGVFWGFRRWHPVVVDRVFRRGQLVSAALYSLGHGGNDAQKTMGIIAGLLFSTGLLGDKFYIPLWVVLSCQAAIALGTMCGGWRIVKTLGQKVTKLRPVDGFCAETAAAATLFFSSWFGIPVSTTHTISGSIMGVGSLRRLTAVRWGVAGQIVWAWILTIPFSAAISALTYYIVVNM